MIQTTCAEKEHINPIQDQEEKPFPFIREGHEWKYQIRLPDRIYEGTYRIQKKWNNYYQVDHDFDMNFQFLQFSKFWYSDQNSFAVHSHWPEHDVHYDLIQRNKKIGEYWEYPPTDSEIKEGEFLPGVARYRILEKNKTVHIANKTYRDVIRIRHLISSHSQFYIDYDVSMLYGLLKMEGIAYEWIDNKLTYVPFIVQLMGHNLEN